MAAVGESRQPRYMPRTPRDQSPGSTHHVTAHGLGGIPLFRRPFDRDAFMELLLAEIRRSIWTCLEYCVMTTHYHVVLELKEETLSSGVGHLNRSYAHHFNKTYGRRGHAFEARFGDRPVATEAHRREVVRYVALNPTRAGICRLPEEYPWSSYAANIGMYSPDPAIDINAALVPFGGSPDAYRAFVEEVDPRARRDATRR
jgi:REP element-mobilizing transposase RayT